MNATLVLTSGPSTVGNQTVVGMLAAVGNAVRKIAVGPTIASTVAVPSPCAPDLEAAFSAWADESLEWAQATFDAQAEAWPAY
ncbi:hypothetical protein [Micromonospora sp. WMMD980]|uniref:hypothetical protein n=1 Tax=Micromonospora sp. WMMD980 TaxID=3016088 RepID=UPI0024163AC1|nr:hypothetical protein [Micromonospora sp. WMMD980]MDG4804610.1 hypothetical protein [Micromonospora sp. WMMD980]